jgi:hypothetical protein
MDNDKSITEGPVVIDKEGKLKLEEGRSRDIVLDAEVI